MGKTFPKASSFVISHKNITLNIEWLISTNPLIFMGVGEVTKDCSKMTKDSTDILLETDLGILSKVRQGPFWKVLGLSGKFWKCPAEAVCMGSGEDVGSQGKMLSPVTIACPQ